MKDSSQFFVLEMSTYAGGQDANPNTEFNPQAGSLGYRRVPVDPSRPLGVEQPDGTTVPLLHRALRWFGSSPNEAYPFDQAIPTFSPYRNVYNDDMVPMLRICVQGRGCLSQVYACVDFNKAWIQLPRSFASQVVVDFEVPSEFALQSPVQTWVALNGQQSTGSVEANNNNHNSGAGGALQAPTTRSSFKLYEPLYSITKLLPPAGPALGTSVNITLWVLLHVSRKLSGTCMQDKPL